MARLPALSARRRLDRLKLGIAAALVGYAAIAVAGDRLAPRREFFPFFSWSLFSDVPAERSTFELYIFRVGDTTFDQPMNFFDLPDHFKASRVRSSTVSKATKSLGRALQWTRDDAEQVRAVFEGHLLREHAEVEYAIVKVVFRPLDRWHSGELEREKIVGRFVARHDG